jgi:hypothetical protein
MTRSLRLVVLGMMGRCPFGGQTWLYLNWLRGLQRLGHDVWYAEDEFIWPYDPQKDTATDDCAYAVRHIAACMERIGLAGRWAFRLGGRRDACWGLSAERLNELYRSSDALLNVVGATALREEHLAAPFRVYVECDPVTAELRVANGAEYERRVFTELHHAIFTYGENYGAADCGVPLHGLRFGKMRQPVDLELWPMAWDPEARFLTTVGNWKQQGNDVPYAGQVYRWSKHHEWEKFLDLPRRTPQPFEVALKIDDAADRARLEAHGWRIVSPLPMSLDIFGSYPAYFRRSRGEWTVAKDQNVRLRSGWFSERDACYLACGKPVIAQDTGFSNVLPTGAGLFAFTTMEDVLAAIDAINSDYRRHCQSARALAEEHFEATAVLRRFLADLGL